MGADQSQVLGLFAELLEEHARLLEEKEGYLAKKQVPPTAINYKLTDIVDRLTEEAAAHREDGEELRDWLERQASEGNLACADALALLADDDPWWRAAAR